MPTSANLHFAAAKKVIPGGVNSPVRAFNMVGKQPKFFECGKGAYLQDLNGKQYIDFVGSWGPLILGHAHPKVIAAVNTACQKGLSFGTPTLIETEMAELICTLMPSIEQLRMVNSGTEATMSAIRLARGYTQKNKIIKFIGCYHGHVDSLLVKAGSGNLTLNLPDSAGIPKSFTTETLIVDFNDLVGVQKLFSAYSNDIAAVIIEPIAGNMNMVLPETGFLAALRQLCTQHDSLLIFDEVMTGFRVALGGAQELYKITPDLTCLGKIIGGGLPVGAFGGKKEIMQYLAPIGPVYQAGTLSGNPIALSAGLATLKELTNSVYQQLNLAAKHLCHNLISIAGSHDISIQANFAGGMFGIKFLQDQNHAKFIAFFQAALANGLYFAPSPFEAGFISTAHNDEVLAHTKEKLLKTFASFNNC